MRRERIISSAAAHHRRRITARSKQLLEGLPSPPNEATQVTWHRPTAPARSSGAKRSALTEAAEADTSASAAARHPYGASRQDWH